MQGLLLFAKHVHLDAFKLPEHRFHVLPVQLAVSRTRLGVLHAVDVRLGGIKKQKAAGIVSNALLAQLLRFWDRHPLPTAAVKQNLSMWLKAVKNFSAFLVAKVYPVHSHQAWKPSNQDNPLKVELSLGKRRLRCPRLVVRSHHSSSVDFPGFWTECIVLDKI